MKKLLFGLAFLGAMAFSGITITAQEEVDSPCLEEFDNSFHGVCCKSRLDCIHPLAGSVIRSKWVPCVITCTGVAV